MVAITGKTESDLEYAKRLFGMVKQSLVSAMQVLYKIHESKEYEQVSSSWGEYVENELQISQGFASKLLTVHKHYLLDGGLHPADIENIDYERLYLAAKSGGTPEEQVEKARVLTRSELKQERQEAEPHVYDPIEYCKVCHGSRQNHA